MEGNIVYKTPQSPPDIYEYVNVHSYLSRYVEWRKSQEPAFSYSYWAEELGFHSRSFLRLILVGKRSITESSIQLFCKGLRLSKNQADYFSRMVQLEKAAIASDRDRLTKELAEKARASGNRRRIHDTYEFLSSYLMPRLQVLITLEGVDRSVRGVSRGLKITGSKAEELLQVLNGLGLATLAADGQWRAADQHVVLEDLVANPAIQCFHRKSLEEAISALGLPVGQRNFQSLTLALTPTQYQELCDDIQVYLQRLIQKHSAQSDAEGDPVLYQLNFNTIPVSEPLLHGKIRAPGGFAETFTREETQHENA